MTAEISSNEAQDGAVDSNAPRIARRYTITAAVFLVLGAVAATFAGFQSVFPEYLGKLGELSYGRMAPASRTLLA